MSRFNGCEFIYSGISSINYSLRIVEFDSTGKQEYESGGESKLLIDTIYRKPKVSYYGRTRDVQLGLDFTVASFDALSVEDQSLIKAWLLGSPKYTTLQIIQDDMSSIFYSCIITKASDIKVGNMGYGLNIHAECDSPWAWEEVKTLTKTYGGGGVANETFNFYNASIDQDYTWPTIEFVTNSIGDGITLTNSTDDGRQFVFAGLSANEDIKVDNYNKIVTSSTGLYRLSKFNLKFFRLLQGMNSITILGAISSFKMTYQFARGG